MRLFLASHTIQKKIIVCMQRKYRNENFNWTLLLLLDGSKKKCEFFRLK